MANQVIDRVQVNKVSQGISLLRWSNKVASIEDPKRQKMIGYIGFKSLKMANIFRDWILRQGIATPYNRQTDSGINKPRRAEKLTDYPYEIEWHRPCRQFAKRVIKADRRRAKRAAMAA
jgi:hypothetical protein